MSRNDQRLTTRSLKHDLRRSLGLWLLIALAVGTWCSQLAGQNAALQTNLSPNVVKETPATNRTSLASKFTMPNLDRRRIPRPSSAAAPTIGSTRSKQPALATSIPAKRDSAVRQTSLEELFETDPGTFGLSPDVPSGNLVPSPLPPEMSPTRLTTPGQTPVFPSERTSPPRITGSHLNLQPGETATERSLRLMIVITELEQQNAELAEQKAELVEQYDRLKKELKTQEAKLRTGASQFSTVRKELTLAQEEFQRLRKVNADLREKYHSAERENTSLMRSLSPLLKQLLQSDADSPIED